MYFYEDIIETYNFIGMDMVWVMRDGDEIMLKDMGDNHIQKCINMLKRNYPTETRLVWIHVFEDVQLKRRNLKINKILNEIKSKNNS
ncbi:MAG: hypothetical protein ACOC2W_04920 [bacterium]